jgi:Ring finger domain
MFTTTQNTDHTFSIMDHINSLDMTIYQNLQKTRERSMSDMSDMSEDISHILPTPTPTEKEADTCCICFEPMNIKKNYCATLCGHAFCFICIVKTMSKQNSCPCCRASLFHEEILDANSERHVDRSSGEFGRDVVNDGGMYTSDINVIENTEMDVESVMNTSLSSNFMIVENENQYIQYISENSDIFPDLQPTNLQHVFDTVDDSTTFSAPMSISLPTYISQEDAVGNDEGMETSDAISERSGDIGMDVESFVPRVDSETSDTSSESVNISDILPSSMDCVPRFGDHMILSLYARMKDEGYTMLDVLMITLMKMYPNEVREDLASYQCARGLNTIIQELQNESKEKELFAMEDRDAAAAAVVVM